MVKRPLAEEACPLFYTIPALQWSLLAICKGGSRGQLFLSRTFPIESITRSKSHGAIYYIYLQVTRGNAVMPLDVLGGTRATLTEPTSASPWPEGLGNLVKLCRAGDRALQLLLFNEECLVSACHQHALITSLPFVHTARRYYRLNG